MVSRIKVTVSFHKGILGNGCNDESFDGDSKSPVGGCSHISSGGKVLRNRFRNQ